MTRKSLAQLARKHGLSPDTVNHRLRAGWPPEEALRPTLTRAVVNARVARGEEHYASKLTAEQVRAVRGQDTTGASIRELATRFGVSYGYIYNEIRRSTLCPKCGAGLGSSASRAAGRWARSIRNAAAWHYGLDDRQAGWTDRVTTALYGLPLPPATRPE